jgi:hypothetical protein
VANAIFFMGYCAGCIASPQLWKHSPRYFSGVVTAIVTWVLLIATISAWWVLCQRENRKRDARADMDAQSTQMTESVVGMDLTDKQDKAFRYSW